MAGPVFDDIVDQDVGASFLSFVYPRGKLRLAAFRHELIRVDQDFESSGVFQNHGFENRDTGVSASRTLAIDSYGGSVAYEAPHVWIGGGAMAQRRVYGSWQGASGPAGGAKAHDGVGASNDADAIGRGGSPRPGGA